jgi:hypothetical protein
VLPVVSSFPPSGCRLLRGLPAVFGGAARARMLAQLVRVSHREAESEGLRFFSSVGTLSQCTSGHGAQYRGFSLIGKLARQSLLRFEQSRQRQCLQSLRVRIPLSREADN